MPWRSSDDPLNDDINAINQELKNQNALKDMLTSIKHNHPQMWSDNSSFSKGLQEAESEIKKLQVQKTKLERRKNLEKLQKISEEVTAATKEVRERISESKEKREKTVSDNPILAELTKLHDKIDSLEGKNDELHSKNTLFGFLGVGIGAVLGGIASYIVAITTMPQLPQIMFTNGTVIFP